MVKLGDKAKDSIGGFVGIATGRAEYLYGCVQVLLAPESMAKDGKVADSVWFDEDRLVVVKASAAKQPASAATRAGGPMLGPVPDRR